MLNPKTGDEVVVRLPHGRHVAVVSDRREGPNGPEVEVHYPHPRARGASKDDRESCWVPLAALAEPGKDRPPPHVPPPLDPSEIQPGETVAE